MMEIVSQSEVEKSFIPYYNELCDSIHIGMNNFLKIGERERLALSGSVKAGALNCFIRSELSRMATRYSEILTAIFDDAPNSCDFVFMGKYAFRVKKLNPKNDRAENSITDRIKSIESNELCLPGMPKAPAWLVLGYIVNPTFTEILRVSLSHQDSSHVNWLIPIGVDYEQQKIALTSHYQDIEIPVVDVQPKQGSIEERKQKEA